MITQQKGSTNFRALGEVSAKSKGLTQIYCSQDFLFKLHFNLILKYSLGLSNGSNVNTVRVTETPLILGARYKNTGNASYGWALIRRR